MTLSKYRTIPRSKLKPGMIVRTPAYVKQEGKKVLVTKIWPGAPAELRVAVWRWKDGETRLESMTSTDHLDLNVRDYPSTFEVRGEAAPRKRAK